MAKAAKATKLDRIFTLQVEVRAPATVTENEIGNAINAALDEPPCDWGAWTVGAATITQVEKVPHEGEDDEGEDERIRRFSPQKFEKELAFAAAAKDPSPEAKRWLRLLRAEKRRRARVTGERS